MRRRRLRRWRRGDIKIHFLIDWMLRTKTVVVEEKVVVVCSLRLLVLRQC
jgi:hypothetical protein